MRATVFAVMAACGLVLVSSAATANIGPPRPKDPPKPGPVNPNPSPNQADAMPYASGVAAAVGAVALGAWLVRRTTRPGG